MEQSQTCWSHKALLQTAQRETAGAEHLIGRWLVRARATTLSHQRSAWTMRLMVDLREGNSKMLFPLDAGRPLPRLKFCGFFSGARSGDEQLLNADVNCKVSVLTANQSERRSAAPSSNHRPTVFRHRALRGQVVYSVGYVTYNRNIRGPLRPDSVCPSHRSEGGRRKW